MVSLTCHACPRGLNRGVVAEGTVTCVYNSDMSERLADKCHFDKNLFKKRKKDNILTV